MKKLNQILQYRLFYAVLLFLVLIYVFLTTVVIKYNGILEEGKQEFIGVIKDISENEDGISLEVSGKEKIIAYINEDYSELHYGDKIRLMGIINKPKSNTLPNGFNYEKYLYYEKIYYIMNVDSYELISNSNNLLYKVKNRAYKMIEKGIASNYIKSFVLWKNCINKEMKNVYSSIGISHLFSVSGMHISLFTSVLIFILKKIQINNLIVFLLVSFLLFFYLFLTNFSPSVVRCSTCFIIYGLFNFMNLKVSKISTFIIAISFILIIDPFIIYKIGFIYSSVLSFFLIFFSDWISKKDNYLIILLKISSISFLSSIPITLYTSYQLNYLSILYNIFAVPFVSFILFPLSLISLILPFLRGVFNNFICIFEFVSKIIFGFNTIIIFKKPTVLFILIYYLLLLSCKKTRLGFAFLLFVIIMQYNYNDIFKSSFIIFFDVGQGDSLFIHNGSSNILIDTGGNRFNDTLTNNLIISLKSFGMRKIDYLVLSHGDYDHMGEAINLVNNFKVEKVIFNCGEFNDLEKELIKVLDKKKIPYYSCIKELNVDNNRLYFLQTQEYNNENDNSNVIYTEIDGYKFMFMGDAGTDKEKDILNKYNISNIDILKVGHHGSKTSSSESFIDEINPKYSIVSVGKNNRYGHPNKEVLNNLEKSKIFRTDQDGSIMFKIKNSKLKIETCSP